MNGILQQLIVACYILCCIAIRTGPWRYFQINARFFSGDKGIFSKLSMDDIIPDKWRLQQRRLEEVATPPSFPVFLKPEWGQNAGGIERADNLADYEAIKKRLLKGDKAYLVQQRAPGKREFEIYTAFNDTKTNTPNIITITEAINSRDDFPINSIYNEHTNYVEITHLFSEEELKTLVSLKQQIARLAQSRLSVRADSLEDLLAGNFHVIEINLFTPFPINLLDESYTWKKKLRFILRVGQSLARATQAIDSKQKTFAVYTRMKLYSNQRSPLVAVLRSFL